MKVKSFVSVLSGGFKLCMDMLDDVVEEKLGPDKVIHSVKDTVHNKKDLLHQDSVMVRVVTYSDE